MNDIPLGTLALEIEEVIRAMPGPRDFHANPDKCVPWLGRASAAMNSWDAPRAMVHFEPTVRAISNALAQTQQYDFGPARRTLLVLLHHAQNDLRLRTTGPLSVGVPAGNVFQYFDELRKLLESAKLELFLVDPYVDPEFVSRYLPSVPAGTRVRILTRERAAALKPALEAFVSQTGLPVEARVAGGFHDRYVFIDQLACYQSGASFKDGAKKALTTLTQLTDAFTVVQATYERLWSQAKVL